MSINLIKTAVLVVILSFFALGFSYIQAAYVGPVNNPPLGNVDAPVNLDDDFQDVVGGIEADAIGVSYGIALPGSPPNGGSRTVADGWPTGTKTADCHLEVRRVDWTTGTRLFTEDVISIIGDTYENYPVCDDYLTPEAKAAGWAASGEDNCLGTSGTDCSIMRPSTCMYTRLVCTSDLTVSSPRVRKLWYQINTNGSNQVLPISLPITSTSTTPLW